MNEEHSESQDPIYVTLSCDTLDEARALVNESFEELKLTMEEKDPKYGLNIPFLPAHVGIGFPMDTAHEVSIIFFAIDGEEEFRDRGEALEETLLTMDRVHHGQPSPVLIKRLLTYILSDVLPLAGLVAWDEFEEPLSEGEQPIVLVDPMGADIDTRDLQDDPSAQQWV